MESWPKRTVEEANLFNPAFCATLLAKAADEFAKKAGKPLPFALAFLVLPVVLHLGTREALPASTITSLLPWIQNNREQLVDFAVRVQRVREITREAILFAAQHEILAAVPVDGVLRQAKRRPVAGFLRSPGMGELAAGTAGEDGHERVHQFPASGGSSALPGRRTRRRPGALRRPRTRRPPGPGELPYERSPP